MYIASDLSNCTYFLTFHHYLVYTINSQIWKGVFQYLGYAFTYLAKKKKIKENYKDTCSKKTARFSGLFLTEGPE